jgi:hypothetical protein
VTKPHESRTVHAAQEGAREGRERRVQDSRFVRRHWRMKPAHFAPLPANNQLPLLVKKTIVSSDRLSLSGEELFQPLLLKFFRPFYSWGYRRQFLCFASQFYRLVSNRLYHLNNIRNQSSIWRKEQHSTHR